MTTRPRSSVKTASERATLDSLTPLQSSMRNALLSALNVPRFHSTSFYTYNANEPTEDRYVIHPDLGLFAVFDGHGGTHCSNFLSNHGDTILTNELYRAISEKSYGRKALKRAESQKQEDALDVVVGDSPTQPRQTNTAPNASQSQVLMRGLVEKGIQKACLMMDDLYFHHVVSTMKEGFAPTHRSPAISGSCGVIAWVYESCVTVANVGDCRVVIGQRSPLAPPAAFQSDAPIHPKGNPSNGASSLHETTAAGESKDTNDEKKEKPIVEKASLTKSSSSTSGGLWDISNYLAVPLTIDQKASNRFEQDLVKKRSTDPDPITVIQSAVGNSDISEVSRVAGILIVTRAFGDGFLKYHELSFSPYNQHVPYITAEPAIATYSLTELDECMIIASDGLWDVFSNEEAISIVLQNRNSPNISKVLVDKALDRVATQHNMSRKQLEEVPYGRRRGIHDDITVIVIMLKDGIPQVAQPQQRKRSSSVGVSEQAKSLRRVDSFPDPAAVPNPPKEGGQDLATNTESKEESTAKELMHEKIPTESEPIQVKSEKSDDSILLAENPSSSQGPTSAVEPEANL